MMRLRGVHARRGGRLVLRGVDLEVPQGTTVAIQGSNGTGKTTLLRVAAGLIRPIQGTVEKTTVGFVGHRPRLYESLTPGQHLAWWAGIHGVDAPRTDLPERPAGSLSRGQRQRLALQMAIAPDPAVLLLDEPYTGLDADARRWLDDALAHRTVLVTSHEPIAADHEYNLREGRLFE